MFYSRDDIDKLKNENVHLSAYYDMYFALREQQDSYKESIELPSINEAVIRQQILEGKPLLGNCGIDLTGLPILFMDLFNVYVRFTNMKSDDAIAAIEELKPDLVGVLEEFLFQKGITQMQALSADSIPAEILVFLIKNTLTPLVEKYSECINSAVDLDVWESGCCPICGHLPALAELKKTPSGRQRFLFCSLCHTPWPFQRLKCPYCDNVEDKETEYFSFPDEENFRVDVCNSCKTYIKTVINNNSDLSPVLLDWSSQNVDDSAARKGYKRAASM
ncbi:MAG: formate dehydrogenase accessory protein FdhE [Candidatus Scalindua sp.]|jgi:FdhE protein|nr:formate dehydrogenase accessory protein FdhE [Candidatus Scalindua sp.]MDV5166339.1 formate dehydrogenase accessory protein FdhE [Candidatus Scalindua sp.]